MCIYPGCYLSTTPPVNQSFPLLFIHFCITILKTFIQSIFTEYLYVPETVLGTGNPAVNYGLSPYPDGTDNLIRIKDAKQLIITVVKDYKLGNTVYNGNVC